MTLTQPTNEQKLQLLMDSIADFIEDIQSDPPEQTAAAREITLPILIEGQSSDFYLGMFAALKMTACANRIIRLAKRGRTFDALVAITQIVRCRAEEQIRSRVVSRG